MLFLDVDDILRLDSIAARKTVDVPVAEVSVVSWVEDKTGIELWN